VSWPLGIRAPILQSVFLESAGLEADSAWVSGGSRADIVGSRRYGCPVTELRLYGRVVQTVFALLGAHEDDVTYSLGWALSQSDDLAYALLGEWASPRPSRRAASPASLKR